MRRWVAVVVSLSMIVAACGDDTRHLSVGPTPLCESVDPQTLLLMAQAVPSASLVPCLIALPEGWEFERAEIETGEATLTFDNDGVGDVEISIVPGCSATGVRVEVQGGDRRTWVAQDDREMVQTTEFDGGCVVVESPARLAASELTRQISFVTRDDLRTRSGLGL